jgi:hypothetical protein
MIGSEGFSVASLVRDDIECRACHFEHRETLAIVLMGKYLICGFAVMPMKTGIQTF